MDSSSPWYELRLEYANERYNRCVCLSLWSSERESAREFGLTGPVERLFTAIIQEYLDPEKNKLMYLGTSKVDFVTAENYCFLSPATEWSQDLLTAGLLKIHERLLGLIREQDHRIGSFIPLKAQVHSLRIQEDFFNRLRSGREEHFSTFFSAVPENHVQLGLAALEAFFNHFSEMLCSEATSPLLQRQQVADEIAQELRESEALLAMLKAGLQPTRKDIAKLLSVPAASLKRKKL